MRTIHVITCSSILFFILSLIAEKSAIGYDCDPIVLSGQTVKDNLVVTQTSKVISKQTVFSEIRRLYLELQNFKNDPQFHRFGFAPGHKYRNWQLETKRLADSTPRDVGIEVMKEGIVPGDLTMLGMEYLSSKGQETEYSRYINSQFRKALKLK